MHLPRFHGLGREHGCLRAVVVGGVLLLAMVTSPAQADVTTLLYTSFEASEGFVLGNLNGQQGWTTDRQSGGVGYTNVISNAPAGFVGSRAISLVSGTDSSTSPRFVYPAGFSDAWTTAMNGGDGDLISFVDIYLPSGQSSTARIGSYVYDTTFSKVLVGFEVQANTGDVYMRGYYDNGGTLGNFLFGTGGTKLGFDQWVTVTSIWQKSTGYFSVRWADNEFFDFGAGAGSTPEEFDFYAGRNGSTLPATAYFDDVYVAAVPVPEPSTFVLASVAMTAIAFRTWRRRSPG